MIFKVIPGVRTNLRNKLLTLGLFPIILMMPISLGLAVYWGKTFGYEQLFLKVNTDLSVAHDAFERIQQDYLDEIIRLGDSYTFRSALELNESNSITEQISLFKEKAGFSYLHAVDASGRWLYEPGLSNPQHSQKSELTQKAIEGESAVGVELFNAESLKTEGLLSSVVLALLPTPYATPTERKVEDRGMMIRVVYPVREQDGSIRVILDGGVLLNGNFGFVDTIRDLVYGPGSLPSKSIGTVTIFLEDVRISTNVPLKRGERALGTRVSREVRDDVFGAGNTWSDLAFVVNDWYISAYEPIYDHRGQRVGMLYAGFLADPFQNRLWHALGGLLLLFLLLMMLSVFIAVRGARQIFAPVAAMTRVVRETRSGNIDTRIGSFDSDDELGELATEFDAMLDKLDEHNRHILQAADLLESKVEERTRELSNKNVELLKTINLLRETRQQLVMAEKLAALGELTAGVAHEINNPLAVMLGNLDVLREELGDHTIPVENEIELIVEQIYRIQEIVGNLLWYSRPNDYSGFVSDIDVNQVMEETLILVNHKINTDMIRVHKQYEATTPVCLNHHELQQVLVNLIINAAHALDPNRGGNIYLNTKDWAGHGVVITVRDDGVGICNEDLGKVFNAFYTTRKSGEGTGIGLSISYGLVKRYGGNLTVESNPGEGAVFRVWLLAEPRFTNDEDELAERLSAMQETG